MKIEKITKPVDYRLTMDAVELKTLQLALDRAIHGWCDPCIRELKDTVDTYIKDNHL